MFYKLMRAWVIIVLMLSGCISPGVSTASLEEEENTGEIYQATSAALPEETAEPPTATATTAPSASPTAPRATATQETAETGPDNFPAGINPLTGLSVSDPKNLLNPPALISVTNFPPTARPQAGLSYSPVVFEMYIGEGESRFLALFYGDYPEEALTAEGSDQNLLPIAAIGPVRSGRLPYESLRTLYSGFLVMSSAYKTVAERLTEVTNVFARDENDPNSAMIDVTQLKLIAQSQRPKMDQKTLSGLSFSAQPPAGGKTGQMLWLPYSYLNQIIWRYDPASGAYHRYQDKADGKTFLQATDRLNGEPLTYENVVVLFAEHHAYYETVIDITLQYVSKLPALLFRDGKVYPIYWTTRNEEYEKTTGKVRPIRFIDANGDPFPLKPGQTWVEIVPLGSPYYETIDSEDYFQLAVKEEPGSGNWAVRFYPPPVESQ